VHTGTLEKDQGYRVVGTSEVSEVEQERVAEARSFSGRLTSLTRSLLV
jgi:hypothetical protein